MKRSRAILLILCILLLAFALCACNHDHQFRTDILKEPTCTQPGLSQNVCLICHAKEEEKEVPALGHEFAKDEQDVPVWTYDATNHWHQCLRSSCGEQVDKSESGHSMNADNECTVCGFAIFSYRDDGEGYTLTKYNGTTSNVVIPATYKSKPVIGIDENVFYQMSYVASVTIPASVKRIGRDAFLNADNLDTVKAESLEAWLAITFDNYAANPVYIANVLQFGETQVGDSLAIPASVTEIKDYAFYGLGTLKTLTVHANVTKIGYRAFEGAFASAETGDKLSADIVVNITDLDKWCAIEFSSGKSDIDRCTANPLYYEATLMLNGVAVEGARTFDCKVNDFAFFGYDKLTDVTYTQQEIGRYAFAHCAKLKSATLNSLTVVSDGLFEGCAELDSVSIGGAQRIGVAAFKDCAALQSIDLPSTLNAISANAFCDCAKLATVTGGDGLAKVEEAAFANTALFELAEGESLGEVYVGHVFLGLKGRIDIDDQSETNLEIDEGTIAIADGALANVDGLVSVKMPASLKYIGKNALRYSGVTTPALTSVELGGAVEIGEYAFAGNSALKLIQVPTTVTKIGKYAFADCSALTAVYTQSIEAWLGIEFENAQANPLALAHAIYFGVYDEDAETPIEAAKSLAIPEGTQAIRDFAFYGLNNITYVELPASLISVGKSAFEGCSKLRSVYYGGESQDRFDHVEFADATLPGTVYFFSAAEPETSKGSYWHYDNEVPTVWK